MICGSHDSGKIRGHYEESGGSFPEIVSGGISKGSDYKTA